MTRNRMPPNDVYYIKPGMVASFRRGLPFDVDNDYNTISAFKENKFTKTYTWEGVPDKETDGYM